MGCELCDRRRRFLERRVEEERERRALLKKLDGLVEEIETRLSDLEEKAKVGDTVPYSERALQRTDKWLSASRGWIYPKEMGIGHLLNAINKLERVVPGHDRPPAQRMLEEEARRRGYTPKWGGGLMP